MSILIASRKNNTVSGKESEKKSEKHSNLTWRGGIELGVQSGGLCQGQQKLGRLCQSYHPISSQIYFQDLLLCLPFVLCVFLKPGKTCSRLHILSTSTFLLLLNHFNGILERDYHKPNVHLLDIISALGRCSFVQLLLPKMIFSSTQIVL